MSFATDMADLAVELLDPAEFGEAVVINRPQGAYDAATRKRGSVAPLTQTLSGSLSSKLPGGRFEGMAERYARVMLAAPAASGGFEPKQDDRVTAELGRKWIVAATAHVIKQGVPILWVCGLETA